MYVWGRLVGNHRVRAWRRGRPEPVESDGAARVCRWQLPPQRAEEFRQRIRDHRFHAHSRGAGGRDGPRHFFLDMRGVPWDGSAGVTLTAAWDGQGMAATQSHAMSFNDFPATRIAWPGQLPRLQQATAGLTQCCFTAVIAGVAEIAMQTAREQVARR